MVLLREAGWVLSRPPSGCTGCKDRSSGDSCVPDTSAPSAPLQPAGRRTLKQRVILFSSPARVASIIFSGPHRCVSSFWFVPFWGPAWEARMRGSGAQPPPAPARSTPGGWHMLPRSAADELGARGHRPDRQASASSPADAAPAA